MCPRLQGRNITEAADDHICTNKLVRSDSVGVCVCVCVCVCVWRVGAWVGMCVSI